MPTVKFSQKGAVVIPVEVRRKYGWKPGARASLVDYGGVVALVPMLRDPVEEGYGILKGGPSLTKALEKERAEERRREENKIRRYRA